MALPSSEQTCDKNGGRSRTRQSKRSLKEDRFVKPREIIMAREDGFITLADRKLFNVLISITSRKPESATADGVYTLCLRDVMEHLPSKSVERVVNSLTRLATVAIMVDYRSESGEMVSVCGHYLSYRLVAKEDGELTFAYDKVIFDLLRSPEVYGILSLQTVMHFRSSYALRLYEILALYVRRRHPVWRVSLTEFRTVMGLETGHERIDNLISGVINPAVSEIIEVGGRDLKVEFTHRKGKLVGLTFRFGARLPAKARQGVVKGVAVREGRTPCLPAQGDVIQ
ncbi:replication initiation protein [Komagataeibacter sp. FNDCR1]|nr:replication initiation protein [Komagataeibacter sp. FNDCR1]